MANNAVFDELTVNSLNIGKTGTMKIKSASSIDMQVGNCQFLVGATVNGTKAIKIQAGNSQNSPDLYINDKRFSSYFSDYISDVYVNGTKVEKTSGTVNLNIPSGDDYLPIIGGTLKGALSIGENTDNQTNIDNGEVNTKKLIIGNLEITPDSLIIKQSNQNVVTLNSSNFIINTIKSTNIENSNNLKTKNLLTNTIYSIAENTPIEIGDISGSDATFNELSTETIQSTTIETTNLTADSIVINNAPVNDTDAANKLYVDTSVGADIASALAQLQCKINIHLLTKENGFVVYLDKNIPNNYTMVETGILYKSNINEESAETDITIDSDATKITTFIDLSTNSTAVGTLRKGHLKTDINNITNLGLNYGIRGYIKVQKNDEVTIIYTNAEVISWNSLNTYEKTLPYIWLTNED